MRIRKDFFPRRPVDIFCFLLIGIFMPIVYIFEMVIVLPAFHESGGIVHTFTLIVALFIVFNIKANLVACIIVDTSVDHASMNPSSGDNPESMWRHCEHCKKLAPPRSWHCEICRTCILKRDHHCYFTGCCIGYENHRYFLMFIFFLFVGSIYAFVYNSLYLWILNAHVYRNYFSIMKMFCPLLMLLTGSTWPNIYLLFYNLNILAVLYSVVLLLYHAPMILHGGVSYERSKGYLYNAGWRKNFEDIFGKRMHLVWLSPFVVSELPHKGDEWKTIKIS